jgi:hypothetical protein
MPTRLPRHFLLRHCHTWSQTGPGVASVLIRHQASPPCPVYARSPLPLAPAGPPRRLLCRRYTRPQLVSFPYSTNISLVYDVYFLIISLKRFSAQFLLEFVAIFVWMVRRGNRRGCNIPACSYNSENCKNILRFWFQNYKNSTSFAI